MEVHACDSTYVNAESGVDRTPGLHLSDVLKSIEKEMGWDYKGKGFEDQVFTMDLGFTWEQALSMAWADRSGVIRPGEYVEDGIICSPDGLGKNCGLINPAGEVLVPPSKEIITYEYKLTWKSSKNRVTDNWYYLTQGKSYCYVMGTTVCFWHVGYLNGNYRGSGPIYRQCWVRFTEAELWQNWQMIMNHAEEKGML